jgi:hypothetical protein
MRWMEGAGRARAVITPNEFRCGVAAQRGSVIYRPAAAARDAVR